MPIWGGEHLSEYRHGVLDASWLRGGRRVQLLLAQDLHPVEQLVPLEHADSEPEHPVRKVLKDKGMEWDKAIKGHDKAGLPADRSSSPEE